MFAAETLASNDSPEKELSDNLQKFILFCNDVVAKDIRGKNLPSFSSFGEKPAVTAPQILKALSDVRNMYSAQQPAFLDCGSGDGMVMALAAMAGFKAHGIELDPKLVSLSRKHLLRFETLGIIPVDNLKVAYGSYYLPDTPELEEGLNLELERSFQQEGILDTDNLEEFKRELFASYGRHRFSGSPVNTILGKNTKAYQELGISAKQIEKGFLPYDAVYHYSSDIASPFGFLPQMTRLLKPGSRIILFQTGNCEVIKHEGFIDERTIPIYNPENNNANIRILIKV